MTTKTNANVEINNTTTNRRTTQAQEDLYSKEKIELIVPTTGKLYFEHKPELVFCKPHLMPLKSQALERLEEMQRDTARQLQEKRLKGNNRKNAKN
ncbi:BBSome-interacting protein 1 [Musca vetustissima]|uniref:BBSome-interacting protein 1 n=1 Tax=Musca vetustissima TaxID=27455 RepID=UPI002AB5F4D1|nr:BBSome-interacting protein 1 [Musca vetustissima]